MSVNRLSKTFAFFETSTTIFLLQDQILRIIFTKNFQRTIAVTHLRKCSSKRRVPETKKHFVIKTAVHDTCNLIFIQNTTTFYRFIVLFIVTK